MALAETERARRALAQRDEGGGGERQRETGTGSETGKRKTIHRVKPISLRSYTYPDTVWSWEFPDTVLTP